MNWKRLIEMEWTGILNMLYYSNVVLGVNSITQGKVINVQPGFLGWFLTKTHPGMEQIAYKPSWDWASRVGIVEKPSWDWASRVEKDMVLPWFCRTKTRLRYNNYTHTSTWVLFDETRVEQHGFYTIPTLDVQSQDGFYAIRMGFC